MTSDMVTVKTKDGNNIQCYVARAAEKSSPVVVVIQEIFGITPWLKAYAQELSQEGFTAIVPDLFFRLEPGLALDDNNPADLEKAFRCYGEFDQTQGVEDLKDVIKFARSFEEANGVVGCTGFCLGGLMAYLIACNSDVDCTVAFYGGGIDTKLDQATKIKRPIMLHFAEQDKFIPLVAIAKISDKLGAVPQATIYKYANVDHAFARTGGHSFNQPAASLANQRTLSFFKDHLAAQSAPNRH
jgi:carboxymethylenebutenolidase